MNEEPVDTPIFAAWTHENLAKFASEAYLKMQAQHDLIQYLRMLVAATPRSSDDSEL